MPGLVDLLRKKGPQGGLDLRQETVAVTGGNGFFGHKLVEALLAAGTCRVVSMDLAHTRAFVPSEQLCLAKVDIRDAAAVQGAIEGVTMVVHSASFFGQPAFGSFGDGADVYAVNVGGTQNVLDAALTAGSKVQRLVYISSSSAILGGDREFVDAPEDTPYPTSYLDHYGPSKAAAERLVLAADSDRLRTCVVRPSGIYGIGETLHLPRILTIGDRLFNYIPIYFAGRPVTVRKLNFFFFNIIMPLNKFACQDWTHVDNLSWGTFLAFDGLGVQGMARKEILHITDGPAIENLDFFRPSLEACGNTIIPLFPVTFWLMLPFVILAELFCLYA